MLHMITLHDLAVGTWEVNLEKHQIGLLQNHCSDNNKRKSDGRGYQRIHPRAGATLGENYCRHSFRLVFASHMSITFTLNGLGEKIRNIIQV